VNGNVAVCMSRNRGEPVCNAFVFVAVETCSNNSPSSSGVFIVATGTCSAKPSPADGQTAAFSRHVTKGKKIPSLLK
jgi:hypothetical protein